jgi:hypothetical protein
VCSIVIFDQSDNFPMKCGKSKVNVLESLFFLLSLANSIGSVMVLLELATSKIVGESKTIKDVDEDSKHANNCIGRRSFVDGLKSFLTIFVM